MRSKMFTLIAALLLGAGALAVAPSASAQVRFRGTFPLPHGVISVGVGDPYYPSYYAPGYTYVDPDYYYAPAYSYYYPSYYPSYTYVRPYYYGHRYYRPHYRTYGRSYGRHDGYRYGGHSRRW